MEELTQAVTLMTKEITRLIQSQERLTNALLESDDIEDDDKPKQQYLS